MVYMRDIWPIGYPKILYRPKRRRVWRYQRNNQNLSRHICYVMFNRQTPSYFDTIYGQYAVGIRFQGTWFHSKCVWNRLCLLSLFLFYPFVLYFIFPSSRVCIYNEYRIAWCLLFILFKRGQNPNVHIILARSNIRFIRRFMDS